jgi:hypothetical protein
MPTKSRADALAAVEDAIVRLDTIGCPCGIPRSDADRLTRLARWVVRRHDSVGRRRGRGEVTVGTRRSDLVAGLLDERQPHGGMGPKADVECLADASLIALGYLIPHPAFEGDRARESGDVPAR